MFGDVVGTQSFYPFGEVRAGTGIFDTERGFTGQIFDGGTGLGFYNARYYDSALGKFISPDSIVPNPANPAHFNRFAYVNNNPLRFTDPTGFSCDDPYSGDYYDEDACGAGGDSSSGGSVPPICELMGNMCPEVPGPGGVGSGGGEQPYVEYTDPQFVGICAAGNGVAGRGGTGMACVLKGPDGLAVDVSFQLSGGFDQSAGLGYFTSTCPDIACLDTLETSGFGIWVFDVNTLVSSDNPAHQGRYIGLARGTSLITVTVPWEIAQPYLAPYINRASEYDRLIARAQRKSKEWVDTGFRKLMIPPFWKLP